MKIIAVVMVAKTTMQAIGSDPDTVIVLIGASGTILRIPAKARQHGQRIEQVFSYSLESSTVRQEYKKQVCNRFDVYCNRCFSPFELNQKQKVNSQENRIVHGTIREGEEKA
jgi:hypothetical protein